MYGALNKQFRFIHAKHAVTLIGAIVVDYFFKKHDNYSIFTIFFLYLFVIYIAKNQEVFKAYSL